MRNLVGGTLRSLADMDEEVCVILVLNWVWRNWLMAFWLEGVVELLFRVGEQGFEAKGRSPGVCIVVLNWFWWWSWLMALWLEVWLTSCCFMWESKTWKAKGRSSCRFRLERE